MYSERFSEAVRRIGTVEQVVRLYNRMIERGDPVQPKPISDAEEHEVWDGGFEIDGSTVYYTGADGPSGGSEKGVRRQEVTDSTVVTYY